MARVFNGSSGLYQRSYSDISDYPFSLFCWFNADVTATDTLIGVLNQSSDTAYVQLGVTSGGACRLNIRNGANPTIDLGSYTPGTWHSVGGTCTSSTSRELWVDGSSVGTNTTSVTCPTINSFSIGFLDRASPTNYFDGNMFWSAIWNEALTDTEHAALGAGINPLQIRPHALVAFVPLGGLDGNTNNDYVSGATFTTTGSPTWTDDSPTGLIYPRRSLVGIPPSVTGFVSRRLTIRKR